MAWELFYTSAARGLRAGSGGYCTVAATEGMPSDLAGRLESLSSYRPVFRAGSPDEARNPVLHAHWRVPAAGRNRSVLTRVAPCGPDYTGRPNTLAYHLVLEAAEQAPAGPVWVMTRPDVLRGEWVGEARKLPPRSLALDGPGVATGDPLPPAAPQAAPPAHAQEEAARACLLADAFVLDPSLPSYLLFESGTDPVPLLAAAMELVPPALRWQVTFSTHFTELPAGLTCAWRCVAVGTPAAESARRHAPRGGLFLDLTRPPGDDQSLRAPPGAFAPHESVDGGHG